MLARSWARRRRSSSLQGAGRMQELEQELQLRPFGIRDVELGQCISLLQILLSAFKLSNQLCDMLKRFRRT